MSYLNTNIIDGDAVTAIAPYKVVVDPTAIAYGSVMLYNEAQAQTHTSNFAQMKTLRRRMKRIANATSAAHKKRK